MPASCASSIEAGWIPFAAGEGSPRRGMVLGTIPLRGELGNGYDRQKQSQQHSRRDPPAPAAAALRFELLPFVIEFFPNFMLLSLAGVCLFQRVFPLRNAAKQFFSQPVGFHIVRLPHQLHGGVIKNFLACHRCFLFHKPRPFEKTFCIFILSVSVSGFNPLDRQKPAFAGALFPNAGFHSNIPFILS